MLARDVVGFGATLAVAMASGGWSSGLVFQLRLRLLHSYRLRKFLPVGLLLSDPLGVHLTQTSDQGAVLALGDSEVDECLEKLLALKLVEVLSHQLSEYHLPHAGIVMSARPSSLFPRGVQAGWLFEVEFGRR